MLPLGGLNSGTNSAFAGGSHQLSIGKPGLYLNVKSVGWFQYNSGLQVVDKRPDAADCLDDAELSQDGGQHRLGLHNAELVGDAHPAPSAERDVGVRMSADAVLGGEAVRVEAFRVREMLRIPVSRVRHHHRVAAGRQHVAVAELGLLLHLAEQIRDWREEPQRLLDHLRSNSEL